MQSVDFIGGCIKRYGSAHTLKSLEKKKNSDAHCQHRCEYALCLIKFDGVPYLVVPLTSVSKVPWFYRFKHSTMYDRTPW
jgi:hypothetical protein